MQSKYNKQLVPLAKQLRKEMTREERHGICGVFVKQLNRPMVTIIGRFLCYALARQRPGLPCVKGAVSEAD